MKVLTLTNLFQLIDEIVKTKLCVYSCCRMIGTVNCLPDCTLSYARCRYRRFNRNWSKL